MSAPLFAEPVLRRVRLALPVPVDRLFDYSVPASLSEAARPGCRALVAFSGRALTGVIVEEALGPPPAAAQELSALQAVVDPLPVLSSGLMKVLRETAAAVVCPIGIALATALPAGSAPRATQVWVATARGLEALRAGALPEAARRLLSELARRPAGPAALARRVPNASGQLPPLERDGLVARRSILRAPAARIATERIARLAEELDVEAVCASTLRRAPAQAALLRRLAETGPSQAAALDAAASLRALEKRGLVVIEERAAPRDVLGSEVEADRQLILTDAQAEALSPVCEAIVAGRADAFLLHGVTGSGKTEVYLRAVAEALARGRQALVLVPEITLTHQIVARLRARFGDGLAVLHSGLRPGERLEQWQRLHRGDTPIAVGARSALFAPLEKLGLIVIDEEHDGAYKNDEGFRYHARDLARRRAAEAGCPLLLGSATPALETRYASDRGELRRLVLPRRIGGRPLPAVELVDLAREKERTPRGRKLILSGMLRRALRETLADGGQSIVFLNRRGFSTQVMCFDCGHAERCKDCDVALVFHATEGRLRCHYCDYQKAPPELCAGCGTPDTALLGIGTERVEEEVRSLLPDARLARLDRDTASRRGYTEGVLRDLRASRLDVLIGTQMVAKGHDFPGVRLVGVVAADLGLHLPDFRAAERTFQLLTQVAGRAGRDAIPGRVVVQTFVPDHYAVKPVRDHDYETFYAEELAHRAALGYPPFGRIAQLMVSAEDATVAAECAARLAKVGAGQPDVEILGPAPAPLPRLRGRYRFQLLAKSRNDEALLTSARRIADASRRLPRGVQASLDVDPVSML